MNLSIVIPVFNSEEIISTLVDEIYEQIKSNNLKTEIILVNDLSKDLSWEKIKSLNKKYSFVKGINLMNNYGQHNAIMAGLNYCTGDYCILMDDDMQHNPKYIVDIYNKLKSGYEICYVKYLKRKHVMWKRFLSYINHVSSSYLSNKSIKIYTSSFKGINKRISYIINRDQNYEVFLDWLIVENSKKIQTIDILHRKRLEGKTNYDFKKLIILWSNMIIKIKPKNKFKILLLSIIKLFIKLIVYKILKKKEYKEKFLVSEKTF